MPEHRPLKYERGQHLPFAPGDTLPPDTISAESFARVFKTCAGADHAPGNAIPTCAELAAAIELAQQTFLNRIVAGPGIAITVGPGGTRIITNTCCDSQHTLVGIVPLATPIVEGQAACWRIEVTPVVAGHDLPLTFNLFGSEQVLQGYPAPTGVVIPVGQTAVEVCVTTLDDSTVLGARELCLQVEAPRLSQGGSACIAILDNDEAPPSPQLIDITSDHPGIVSPGDTVCWTVYLNGPAPAGGFPFVVTVSGAVVDGGQVCASYDGTTNGVVLTTLSGQIVAGATTATVCHLLPATPGLPAGALARDAGQCFALDCTPPNANVYTADLTIAPSGAIGGAAAGAGGHWIGSSGANPVDYEVRVSGGLPDGPDALDAWLPLAVARAWTRTLACGTSATIGGRVQIRRISDQQLVVDEPYGGYQVFTGVNAQCP